MLVITGGIKIALSVLRERYEYRILLACAIVE